MFKSANETISFLRLTQIAPLVILLVLAFGLSGPLPVGAQANEPNPYDLQYLRSCHTATTLADGRVLVTGGYGIPAYNPAEIPPQVLNAAEIYNPSTGIWTLTGSLKTARQNHTATLLPDGRVLVAGGDNGSTCLRSVEIYDPVLRTWSLVGNLITPRGKHTASLLANGTVLIVGGRGGLLGSPALADNNVEAFDFQRLQSSPAANLNTPRVNHAAIYEGNQVMVMGGFDDNATLLKTYEVFDASTGKWYISRPDGPEFRRGHAYHTVTLMPTSEGGIMWAGGYDGVDNTCVETFIITDVTPGFAIEQSYLNEGRLHHTATLLSNGKVVVTGGWNQAKDKYLSGTEVYDPKKKSWSPGNFLAHNRAGHTASLLATGEILLVGGFNDTASYLGAELYYPDQGLWYWPDDFGNFRPRDTHTATLLANGKVLVAGGQGSSTYLSSAQLYTDNKFYGLDGTWTDTAPLVPARASHTATLLPCGMVLVAGGETPTVLNSVRLYDPDQGTWRPTQPLKQARYRHTATLLADGQVLVTGGRGGTDRMALASTELYDPAKGSWTLVGALNIERAYHTATLLYTGQVLVTGGVDANWWDVGPAELYDPVSRTWSQVKPMATPRDRHTATLLPNGRVLVAGGWDNNNTVLNSAEIFDPVSKTWAGTGNLHEPRIRHSAALLPDGLVLVAGGNGTGDPRTFPLKAELYNPATGKWMENGSLMMDNGRFLHTATLLNTGNVLLAGGYNDADGTLATYSTYTNILGLDPGYRPQIVSVEILPPPHTGGLTASSTGSGFCLGVTLAATMSDFLVSQQLTQGTQVQLMALEDKQLLLPGIDGPRSTSKFLVTGVIEKAAEDIYQTIVSIGGITSAAHLIRIGKGQVPPRINNTPATMLLHDR